MIAEYGLWLLIYLKALCQYPLNSFFNPIRHLHQMQLITDCQCVQLLLFVRE